MASNATHIIIHLITAVLLLLNIHHANSRCYSAIFSFGDSLQDTGNFINTFANTSVSKPPWGITYFRRPTGRFSDGRLIIDFIAQALGLPMVPPSRGGGHFSHGANFAFAGATCLDNSVLAILGINVTGSGNFSLAVEIGWFQELLQSVPSLADPKFLAKSLFMVGEIGGNDYNRALAQDLPIDKIKRTIVPVVVQGISSGISTLIGLGAKTLVVPGNLPIGSIPTWLGKFHSPNPGDYDAHGCLIWMNEFSKYHNLYLKKQLNRLKRKYPNVTIAYADFYASGMRMFVSPKKFGITKPFTACCGGNGHGCDGTGPVCGTPLNYASWEGFHPTEATYHAISKGLIRGPFDIPFLNKTCAN